jgi:hypothetical protein
MAVLSLVEQLKSATDPVMSGVIENIVVNDQLTAFLPWASVPTGSVSFVREKANPTTVTPSSGATITEDSALEDDKVTAFVRRFLIDQTPDVLDARSAGGMRLAKAKAVARAAKSLAQKYGVDVISGNANWTVTVNSYGGTGYTGATIVVGPGHDSRMPVGIIRYTHSGTTVRYKAPGDAEFGASVAIASGVKLYSDNPNKWVTLTTTAGSASANGDIVFTISPTSSSTPIDGMVRLVAAGQVISSSGTNGDAISLAALDQLIDTCKDKSGRKHLIMLPRTRRQVMALLRASGGVTMMELTREYIPSLQDTVVVPSYNNVPMLATDNCPTNRSKGSLSTGTMVFCATFGEEGGLCGIYSSAAPGDGEDNRGEIVSEGNNGLTVLDLGSERDRDAHKVRVRAYWGLKNASELGLAALDEII